jgi:hypothetical protein
MCVITDVRRFGCAPSSDDSVRSRASSRSICAIETSSPAHEVSISDCALNDRPDA